ncbi:hypothetical protein Pfo_026659 [Paulownia fortunei]|nr:hypothetical protein Pfo_026659 [Paulownia fortunei]
MTCSKNHIPTLVLLLAILTYSPSAHSTVTSYEIVIQDELPKYALVLVVVCKAGGQYVGGNSLRGGETFRFTYNVDADRGTPAIVFCQFRIGPKRGNYGIFDFNRDEDRCGEERQCIWSVAPPGIYQYYENKHHLIYRW